MVEKSSVNTAIKKLTNFNLVVHEKYGNIILTKKGEEEASCVKAKHDILLRFLNDILGLTKKEAEKEACKIEHTISNNTFERLSKFIEFLDKSPFFDSNQWLKSFDKYIQTDKLISTKKNI